ncbi:MAG: DUF2334 domain-containing protein [Planctomycetota bacterium]
MSSISWLVLLIALSAWCCPTQAEPVHHDAPRIVLKLDDMKHRGGTLDPGWQMTLAYLDEHDIPASIGVVGNTLENAPQAYLDRLIALDATGRYELWNHGWSHTRDKETGIAEFRGSGFEYQLDRFARTQQFARDTLGIDFVGFGAPYNQTDADTARVIEQHPEVRWWMYPPRSAQVPRGVLPLYRVGSVNIEIPVHNPNPQALREAFPEHRDEPVLVIQGHPMSWDVGDRFEKFTQIIEYLRAEGCTFVLPRDLSAEVAEAK